MNLKNEKSNRNSFFLKYNEKDAINGHSVDRFNYAIQLANENSDESLIKAYGWFSLAADEIDMHEESERLKHKVSFELKKRGLFEKALKIESEYRSIYSREAYLEKIKKSKNPFNIFLRLLFRLIEDTVEVFNFIDSRFFRKKGSSTFWGVISSVCSIVGFILLVIRHQSKLITLLLAIDIIIYLLAAHIYENRSNKNRN